MNASSPLPVELLSFTGRCNGSQNILSWTTATELNNDYFELQRSEDAIHFHTIQLIKSKAPQGNSTTKLDYEVIDDNILNASIYYRLQQFDLDHHAQYSTVVELRRKNASDRISMYPNPSHGNFNVSIPNEYLKNMMLYIQNIQGETIYQQAITNTDTNIQWPHSGVYLLTVKSPNFIQTQKIFIQAN
jgi:hypothetical protein